MRHRILTLVLLCLPLATVATPKRAYITDRMETQLRTGQSAQHRIVKILPTGTPVTVLSERQDTGYSLVRLDDGEDGWVLTRFLSNEPAARDQFQPVQEENQRLKQELAALKSGKDGAEQSARQKQTEVERLNTELIAIRQASANVLQIQAERDRLQEHVIHLERDLESIRREKTALDGDYRQNWFLIGAGVLFGGIVLGLILPKISWRKKTSWDSF